MTSSQRRTKTTAKENLDAALRRIDRCIKSRDETLDLTHLGLSHIPEEVASLTWLTSLRAGYNAISEVPEFICQLTQLHTLALVANPIRSLHRTLYKLTNLAFLSIGDAEPAAVDPVIGKLNLKILTLAGVGLHELPAWIPDLKNLKVLNLRKNRLTDLPNSLSNSPQL